jgi:drug/metabolite transporter (DMT)-like permease
MSLLFYALGKYTNTLTSIQKKDLTLFLLRGLFILLDFSSFSYAVSHLPLGTTLFLFYAAFITVNFIYGSLILHEKITIIKTVSSVLAMIGLYIIYRNDITTIHLLPALAAINSGAFFGLVTSTSKTLSDKYSPSQINLGAFGITAILTLLVIPFTSESLSFTYSFHIWLAIILFSFVLTIANYAIIIGFKYIEAQKASLILLAEIIFTIIVGMIFYKEIPSINVGLGGLFITIALALPNIPFKKNAKR